MSLKTRAATLMLSVNPKSQWAYRALQYSPSRPPLWPLVRSEDWELRAYRRKLAWNTAQDLYQNLTLVGFMVRTHMNFTSNFEFQPRTGDPEYDLYLKRWMRKRTLKQNVDVYRRQSFDSMFRSWCSLKALNGDTIMTKAQAGRLQLFEAWNIAKGAANTEQAKAEVARLNDVGLELDAAGAVANFGIATGDDSGNLVHRMLVPWDAAIYDGDFTRPSGVRPASCLLPAMNFARDFLDNTQFRLTRAKIEAMFGMIIYRDHTMKGGFDFQYGPAGSPTPTAPPQTQVGVTGTNAQIPYIQYNLQPGLKLELEREDKAEFLESKTPSKEWLEFSKELGRMILAAKNIPYTLYDSTAANYSSLKGDRELYKQSSLEERNRNRQAKAEGYDHILAAGIADGSLEPPLGITRSEDINYHLVNRGTWLLDLTKEGAEIRAQVAAGHLTNEDACDQLGTGDFYEVTERLAAEQEYQRSKGVVVTIGLPGAIATGDTQSSSDGITEQ